MDYWNIIKKKVKVIKVSKYKLLLVDSFKKTLSIYDKTVVDMLKLIKAVYSDIPLNLQLLL